ncbi:MAG TPA: SRPBCC domain-containing protein [Sphingomicrobium sp.]|nr:SRPBCC domain-containing protein [Sphingomicrobium sp.]
MAETALAPIERVSSDSIRLERLLEALPEKVWDYLTRAELREQWFMGGTDAPPKGEFELLVDHDKLSEEEVPYPDGFECMKGRVFHEKVLKFDPPRLLETTFQGGKGGIVTYELFPEGEKTRLVLTHSGIADPSGFRDFGGGWTSHLAVLQEKLAGGSVKNFWALHAKCRDAVAKALG